MIKEFYTDEWVQGYEKDSEAYSFRFHSFRFTEHSEAALARYWSRFEPVTGAGLDQLLEKGWTNLWSWAGPVTGVGLDQFVE